MGVSTRNRGAWPRRRPCTAGSAASIAYERARKELFAEGISSSKIYLDPLRPSVEDLVDMITSGVRSSFTYAGASTVAEFHERATVGLQSAAGYEEGKALPVSW
jgi:IMP dehydrogenase